MSALQGAVGDIRREETRQKIQRVSEPIMVQMTPLLRAQLDYWRVLLPTCSGRIAIPDLLESMPPWTINFYTDAAGGTLDHPGAGLGAVGPFWWSYMAWPRPINHGKRDIDGKLMGQKLCLLELLGPLMVLSAGYEVCGGKDVRVWVDNKGAVQIFQKGYSPTCSYCTCVAKAISVVAGRIGCRISIEKITRCSTVGAVAADALSKADFGRFLASWPEEYLPLPDGARVPLAFLRWLNEGADPLAPLGEMILEELGL